MAGTKEPGPTGQHPNSGIVPSRTPGPPGINDQADPTVIAQQGDTPGAAGVNDYHPPRLLNAGAGPNNPTGQQHTHGSPPIVGTGLSSATRIPLPAPAPSIA